VLTPGAIEQFKALAAARGPLLIATDLDGTLAPIVRQASDARVPPATLAVLDRLTTAARVAVITGRDLNTARRMVPCQGVVVVGSHGLEASLEDGLLPGIDRMGLGASLELVEQKVISQVPSVFLNVERKAISTAFHFRTRPELEPGLRAALHDLPAGLRLREGRMVLEVLPDAQGGKDLALEALVRHFRARALMVMGDDRTDVAMFKTASQLREPGRHVLLVGVSAGAETPPEIEALSDVFLGSTNEALEALETVAQALNA
jgi:trehalose-phosphatase